MQPLPESAPSAVLRRRNRQARVVLLMYRARHAEDGAIVTADERAVHDELAQRLAAADDLAGQVAAREWAVADLERLGVPLPVKIPAAELRGAA